MALKIGIVGLGGIGNTHAKAHIADDLAELVAVCDVKHDLADKAGEEYNVKVFYSLKEMLEAMPEIDVVDITTSGYENGSWHYVPVMEALAAKKNVLVEKPISNDINEAREMVRYATEQDVYLGCNLNHYFSKPAERARELINEDKIGEHVYMIHKIGFNGGESDYDFKYQERWDRPYSHMKAFLTHPFSVMRYFGGNITHVQAFMNKPGVRKSAQDLMLSIGSIHVRFEDGSCGYLLSQRGDAIFGLGGWWSFEMAGTKGTFVIENCVEKLMYWDACAPKSGQGTLEPTEVLDTKVTDFSETFPMRIHAYLEDVTNNVTKDKLRSSGRDALATLEYIFAAITSFEEGGSIVRPEALPAVHGDIYKPI